MKLGIFDRLRRRPHPEVERQADLDLILENSLRPDVTGEIYPDDAGVSSALIDNARERILRNSHFFNDTWFRTNTLDPTQKDVVCAFLLDLAQVVRSRGVMLTSEVIEHVAEMLDSDETELAHWQEPWMVPYKITRRRAVDLFEHCLAQTSRAVPFERLAESGMKAKWARSYGELGDRLRADSMDGSSLMKVFHTALIRVARQDDRSDVRSICYTMDYALACIGDRSAMMRISETLRRVCVLDGDDDESLLLTEARRNELSLISDSWRRMSSIVRSRPMGDGERELAEMIAPLKMDMRRLDEHFADKPGWVLPPANVVPLASGGAPGGDWRLSLFEPSPISGDLPPLQRPVGSLDANRQAQLIEMFTNEDVIDILKRMATDDASADIDDPDLKLLAEYIEKAKASKKTLNLLEASVAGLAAVHQSRRDGPNLYAEVFKGAGGSRSQPPAGQPEKPRPSMKVLDKIGPSEDSNRGSAEATFARLLEPFDLREAKVDADRIYNALSAEFPWMRDANEMVAKAVALAARSKTKAFKLKPVLLNGVPGIGKTRWIRRVSEISGIPTHMTNLAGVNTTKSIIGSERGWSSARPSLPAYAFLSTDVANPIIYVDEIDKASGWEEVADAFLPMLEEETSGRYADIYLLGNMNLDAASFMFSANDLSKVSAAFLSRVEVVHVRAPNEREVGGVISAMLEEIGNEAMLDIFEIAELSERLLARSTEIYIRNTNLRMVRKFIEAEVGKTIWTPPGPRLVT